VPLSRGVKAPVINDLERALKRAGVTFRIEDHHHPAHWIRREGRIVAEWKEKKEALIKKVAQRLEVK
jgi:signal recognition particle subunit SRP19